MILFSIEFTMRRVANVLFDTWQKFFGEKISLCNANLLYKFSKFTNILVIGIDGLGL